MSRAVLVLGMHRSGTSSLAGSLEEHGLFLGDVITVAPHNAKGNRENKRIMDLHDELLKENGASWDDPPNVVEWSNRHRERRDAIVRDYGSPPLWGFKDPRTLFTLEGWLEVLDNPLFVGTFRHPNAVATSLVKRNGRDREKWWTLWRRYNERLVALRREVAFPIVCFDLDEEAYRASVADAARRLGLSKGGPARFFEPSLKHHRSANASDLPPDLARLYAELVVLSQS